MIRRLFNKAVEWIRMEIRQTNELGIYGYLILGAIIFCIINGILYVISLFELLK